MDNGQQLYEFAKQYLPGGVAASTRFNRALGRPFYISRGDGSKVYDRDGREYIDMCCSHGASILGHNHPALKAAIQSVLDIGICCSYETDLQSRLAEKLCQTIPCAEMVRYAGSGTETIMHALRLVRAASGKNKIIKFEGHFNGYDDYVNWSTQPPLDKAGPADRPTPYRQSAGIPEALAELVVVVPFNDPAAIERAIVEHKDDAACVLMEPINYDSGCIIAKPGYLQLVRDLTAKYGMILVWDEVLTAARVAPGGAQEYYGITPDLAVMGKATAGGLPLSAIVGKRAVMSHFRPLGNAEHSGTYLGHLITVAGALATMEEISRPGVHKALFARADQLYAGIRDIIKRAGVKARLQGLGPRFTIYFGLDPDVEVTNWRQAAPADTQMTLRFIKAAIDQGVYFHDYGGKPAHHGFSTAHTKADIDRVLEGLDAAFKTLK
jgi:glutamate-1-semialdehyde 2,1-aminomutase